MKSRITLLTLGVDDLEHALRFYRDGLGWKTEGIVGAQFEHFQDLDGHLWEVAWNPQWTVPA